MFRLGTPTTFAYANWMVLRRSHARIRHQGRSQKFVSEGDKTGGLGGQKSPSGVQGQNPGGDLGAPEAEDMLITIAIALTKKN